MDYRHALRRRWRTVVVTVLLGAIAPACITVLLPRTYVAKATSFVSITEPGGQGNSLYQNLQFALNQVASYTELAEGKSVLAPVISQLHLSMMPEELAAHVSASNPSDTVLLTVQADGSDPEQTQRIANAVAVQLGKEIESLETPRPGGDSSVTVRVAVPAGLPSTPVSPRPVLNVLIGLALGLAVGASIAIAREQMDTTVKSADELHDLAGVPPLGSIAEDGSIEKQPFVAARHDSIDVEAFRSIRTSLQFADVDGPPRQVIVTSAMGDEGKTVVACNLAIAMTQTSRRVCLVEGNLRQPAVGRYLGLRPSAGLVDVVAGRSPLNDALVSWNGDQLTVLQAGTTAPDPTQLLGSRAMTDLLATLRERFDMLVIDAPPVLPVSDSAVLAHSSDGTILVARYGHTKRDDFSTAIGELEAAHARLIGTILTRVPAPRRRDRSARNRAYGGADPVARSDQSVETLSQPASQESADRPAPRHASELTRELDASVLSDASPVTSLG